MRINKIIQGLLLVSALGTSAYATGAQSVSGPMFLFKGNGPLDGSGGAANPPRPRAILHAFDLSLVPIERYPTFDFSYFPIYKTANMSPLNQSYIDTCQPKGVFTYPNFPYAICTSSFEHMEFGLSALYHDSERSESYSTTHNSIKTYSAPSGAICTLLPTTIQRTILRGVPMRLLEVQCSLGKSCCV